jgi:transcriptional regulator of heat shock response
LEWETRDQIREIIRDFEEIDLRLERIARAIDDDDGPRFFIGRKSPVTRSDSLSVILGGFGEGEGKFLLCAIGPKRMDYSKAARLFLGLKKMEEQVENETNKRYGGGK